MIYMINMNVQKIVRINNNYIKMMNHDILVLMIVEDGNIMKQWMKMFVDYFVIIGNIHYQILKNVLIQKIINVQIYQINNI